MIEYYTLIILSIICFILSAFFSGSEVALFSITRARVRTLVNEGRKGANALSALKADPDRFLITILIGNNIANVAAASMATALAIVFFGPTGLAITVATGVVVIILLIFGEIGPKMYATRYTSQIALAFSPSILFLSRIFSPLIWIFNRVVQTFGGSPFSHHEVTEEEIREWIDVGKEEGTIEQDEQEMLYSVLEFGDTIVREVMTPRIDVVMMEDSKSPEDALKIFHETGFSRLPVYHETIDSIVGVLNIKDVFHSVLDPTRDLPITALTSEPFFAPDTKKIDDLLREMQRKKVHLAIVLDEYGSFDGIATIEDVLEELVGDILDEFDTEETDLLFIHEGVYSVDARMWVCDLNKKLDLSLPVSEDYETIAGLLIDKLGHIPKVGESLFIEEHQIRLNVLQMKGKRILRLKLIQERSTPGS